MSRGGIVFSRGFGVITDEELREHARSLKSDPQFQPTFKQFADFSAVTGVEVTAAGVASIIGSSNRFPPDAVRAIFARNATAFGLARLFEARHDASGMLVTRSREEAERHVGIAPGESLGQRPPRVLDAFVLQAAECNPASLVSF